MRHQHNIVLEWVEESLLDYLDRLGIRAWESFADEILLPLLTGLSLAYPRRTIHRDIKPANILVTEQGQPKLTDFGIAKLIRSTRLGQTVREFRPEPYSPPLRANSTAILQYDLFSLGVTILECLIRDRQFKITHQNLPTAIRQAGLPRGAERYVSRLVSMDPNERPINAAVALADLRRLRQVHLQTSGVRAQFHLQLLPVAQSEIRAVWNRSTLADVQQFVLHDLESLVVINYRDRMSTASNRPSIDSEY